MKGNLLVTFKVVRLRWQWFHYWFWTWWWWRLKEKIPTRVKKVWDWIRRSPGIAVRAWGVWVYPGWDDRVLTLPTWEETPSAEEQMQKTLLQIREMSAIGLPEALAKMRSGRPPPPPPVEARQQVGDKPPMTP